MCTLSAWLKPAEKGIFLPLGIIHSLLPFLASWCIWRVSNHNESIEFIKRTALMLFTTSWQLIRCILEMGWRWVQALTLSLHDDIFLCLHRPCLSRWQWFLALGKQMVRDRFGFFCSLQCRGNEFITSFLLRKASSHVSFSSYDGQLR